MRDLVGRLMRKPVSRPPKPAPLETSGRPVVGSTDDGRAERAKSAGRIERQQAIGAELRKAFEELAAEDTPSRLKALAETLDRKLRERGGN